MGQHRELGRSRSARRRYQERDIVGGGPLHDRSETARLTARFTPRTELGQRHEHRVVVETHPPLVRVDDALDVVQAVAHLKNLVHLLLIFDDGDLGVTSVGEREELLAHGVWIDTNRNRTERLRGQLCVDPVGPVVADDGDFVVFAESEQEQAETDRFHAIANLTPRQRSPDSERLLTKRRRFRRRQGALAQEFG